MSYHATVVQHHVYKKKQKRNSIAGCGLNGMTELCDTSIASNCYTNTEHDLSYQKSACDANPNCAWDATKTINKCYVPIPAIPILVKEKKGFKKDAMEIQSVRKTCVVTEPNIMIHFTNVCFRIDFVRYKYLKHQPVSPIPKQGQLK